MMALAVAMLPLNVYADGGNAKQTGSQQASKKKSSSKKRAAQPEPEPETPEPVVEFSDEQVMLNNQAVDAAIAGDYKKAEQLFNAMLQLGEMNIIWMNVGGVYVKQGKCMEARNAFEHVFTSPKITNAAVTTEDIESRTRAQMRELETQCNAQVIFECKPEEMQLTIDSGEVFECHKNPIALTPGRHSVFAQTNYGFNTVAIDAVEQTTTTIPIEVINYEQVAVDIGATPEEIQKQSTLYKALGYSFLGVGVAVAAGGGALLGVSYSHYNSEKEKYDANSTKDAYNKIKKLEDETNTKMTVSYGLMAFGGAMAVTGIALVIYDAVKFQPTLDKLSGGTSFRVAPAVSPEFTGLAFSGRF